VSGRLIRSGQPGHLQHGKYTFNPNIPPIPYTFNHM
jgi:hypothetical protein